MTPADVLEQYVIYDHPADYPEHFVVRRWVIGREDIKPDVEAVVYLTLDEARCSIPRGLVCISRSPEDASCIVEVWI